MGTVPEFVELAAAMGRALAELGVGLIYGGARVGLMGVVADACLGAGGRVVGVIPEVLAGMEVAHAELTELHVTTTMHTRKALMAERAEAFVILPGGLGTMEEMFEVLAWQTIGLHTKPVVLVNVAGFYDSLLRWMDEAVAAGVLRASGRAVLLEARSVEEALALAGVERAQQPGGSESSRAGQRRAAREASEW